MTFNTFLPPKTWAYMVALADQYGLSTKEIQRVVLNKVFFEMGMICEHKRIGYAKTDKKPYCKDCWSRLNMKEDKIAFKGRIIKQVTYEQLETFLDKKQEISEAEREKCI